jgi:hypothetical protein
METLMRRLTRLPNSTLSFLSLLALAAGCSSAAGTADQGDPAAGPALSDGRAPKVLSQAEWRATIAKTPAPKDGCFRATAPSTKLEEIPCADAPIEPRRIPGRMLVPGGAGAGAPQPKPGPRPDLISGGNDFNAKVTGLLTSATGSFPSESGGTNESDVGGTNSGANSYSLQMNTNLFGSGACSGSTTACTGWEQLVYDPQRGIAYFEFSLVNFGGNCPGQFGSNYIVQGTTQQVCYFNSASVSVPGVAASNLPSVSMKGSTNGTSDTITMTVNGTAYVLSQPSVLGLANGWNDVDFNVFGENNSSQAQFNSATSIEVQVLTQSATPTRAAPKCPSGLNGSTAETNTLSLIGSCCAFGGDTPGIQFLESNAPGATAPACPALTATPSPVSIPSGSQGYTTLSVVGNLVGQSSNNALQPKSCNVTGQVTSWQNTAIQGEEWFFTVPSSASPGSTLTDTATCDIGGPALNIPIAVANPKFTASPNPLVVTQGSCGWFQAAIDPNSIVPPVTMSGNPNGLPAGVTLTGGGTANTSGQAEFEVCASSSAATGFYTVPLATSGNVPADANTGSETVEITACQPIPESQACGSSSGYATCGTVSGGCGVQYVCPACGTGTSCSNNVCCPSGEVGSDGTCCPSGQVYYSGIGCSAPCAAGTIPCPILGFCATETACSNANNGGCTPAMARRHMCS